MQTILGPFHPYLENALVEETLRYKKTDLLCPLLILVPSDSLRRRLKILLTRERGFSFVNLQTLTFHQLSSRLFAEVHGIPPPQVQDDLFLEEVLRQMIRTRQPGTQAFAGIEERAGGCAALWQTLRDLRDGLVDPGVALEALREDHFTQRASQRTSDLLGLLQTLLRFCTEKNIQDHSDLDKAATKEVPVSEFLKQFSEIFCYGFYDLTQIQVDFFHAIARHHPTTLFFPLLSSRSPHEGWSFAENFFQRYVQGRGGTEQPRNLVDESAPTAILPPAFRVFDRQLDRPYQALSKNWRCTIFNTFGIHDETRAVAKEILRLAGDEGLRFDEIGVVARSLDAYGATIKEVFIQHQIPIIGAIEEPLLQFPLTKAAILLLNLPAKNYLRSQVIDLLSSPYFRSDACGDRSSDFRPDLWDLATRELAICKGMKEWERLERYAAKDLVLSQVSLDDELRVITIPAAELRALREVLRALASDLARLPAESTWSQYAATWKELFKKRLGVAVEPADDSRGTESEIMVRHKMVEILDQIAELDTVTPNISLREFSQTFEHWLERAKIVVTNRNIQGVAVSNAEAARGLKFRALFILGLNEGVFPRTIREDAFLRDRDRVVLERDLGFKVGQKLAGFDEEKLVFSLLVNAARERLYCSFQRSDESGRVLAPSWYLDELKRAVGDESGKQIKEETIPRSITDKTRYEPFSQKDLLLPEELAIQLSLSGEEAASLIQAANLSPNIYKPGVKTVERLDLGTQRLNEFDGMVKDIESYWLHFTQQGLSPTGLELYGRCPFQYFARRVLGLQRLEAPEEALAPSMAEYGDLGHTILKNTFQELIDRGYFTDNASSMDVDEVLATAAQQAFKEYELDHPIGYPLAWENLCESLTELIRTAVHSDLNELQESGYVPIGLEAAMSDQLPADWPEILRGLAIRGRMDRIDSDRAGNRLRIVDYKFKLGASPSTSDRDLYRAALRGEKLQPPVYSLLGKRWAEVSQSTLEAVQVEASFYYIAPFWTDGPLLPTVFRADALGNKIGHEIKNTIAELVAGIKAGKFFIQRGPYCQYCEVAEICRKNHPPSLWRAENDPITAPHRQLRDKDPKKL